MIFDLIAGMNAGGGAATWTPAELFKSGEVGFWLDGSDYSTMSQSRTAEVAVTGAGQPVGQWHNKIAGQSSFNFVAPSDAARALTKATSGKLAIVYDGVDDQSVKADTGNIAGGALSVFIGQKTGNVSAIHTLYFGGDNPGSTTSIDNLVNRTVTVNALGESLTSTELTSNTSANIIGMFAKQNVTPLTVRVNGIAKTGSIPTGATITGLIKIVGSTLLYSEISQVVFINRVLTPTEITQLETFIGSKQ